VYNITLDHAENIGWQSQAIEAQLFAYLAARRLENLPSITGVKRPIIAGKVSLSIFLK